MKILFLCVANSARSQIAEGLANHLLSPGHQAVSAGSNPSIVHPTAILVMKEIGIDISHHQSKFVETIDLKNIDLIITLCAEEVCPIVYSTVRKLHWPLSDPAATGLSEMEQLAKFRATRDQIQKKILQLKESIQS